MAAREKRRKTKALYGSKGTELAVREDMVGDNTKTRQLTHWSRNKIGRHFADDIFKRIFLNENIWIPIKISLKMVPKGSFNNIPALVQIMAWRRAGDKPLSELMLVRSLTHICVTRPQWVKKIIVSAFYVCLDIHDSKSSELRLTENDMGDLLNRSRPVC